MLVAKALLNEPNVDWELESKTLDLLALSQTHADLPDLVKLILQQPLPSVVPRHQMLTVSHALLMLGRQKKDEETLAFLLRYAKAEGWGTTDFTFEGYENSPANARSRLQSIAIQAIADMGPELALPALRKLLPDCAPNSPAGENLRVNIEHMEARQRGEETLLDLVK